MKEVQIAEEQSKTTLVFQIPEFMVDLLNSCNMIMLLKR